MLLSEEEAKTKWCPHAVASHTDPRGGFRNDGRPIQFSCIASACMAWRWAYSTYDTVEQRFLKPGEVYSLSDTKRYERRNHTGWCGLAGRPE